MNLSGLTIGSLELSPEFDPDVTEYTATAAGDSDVVTAETESRTADLAITLNGETLENGGTATWITGENTLVFTVSRGEDDEKVYTVTVTKPEPPSADLSALTIGSLELTPAFDAETTSYTAATTNATNKVTATPVNENATMVIKVGDTQIENGESASWEDGDNTLTIALTMGELNKTYTVTVTKS